MIILGTNSIKDTGYDVANSCRFDDGDNARISKTFSSAGNSDTWTMSAWVKRSTLGANSSIFTCNGLGAGAQKGTIRFDSSDKISAYVLFAGSAWHYITSDAVYRDTSAWYHVVVRCDTTQSTNTDRLRLYVNGTLQTLSGSTYPDQNEDTFFNEAEEHQVASLIDETEDFDGYMAEFCWIDGSSLAPDQFGEFDDSGIWKPIDVSGLTFGTNGVYLDFEDSSDLGKDASGNSDWTATNLAATDQSTDTCTNNFATLNSLYKQASSYTIADGNLTANNTSNTWRGLAGTIGVSSGKWYWEAKAVSGVGASNFISFGIGDAEQIPNGDAEPTASSRIYSYKHNGDKANNNTQTSYGATWTNGDIISILYDADNGTLKFYKNGSDQGNAFTGLDTSKTWLPITENYGSSAKMSMNFGSPPYAISSGNTDADGYGNFEYAVPSGYYSLNTKNLAEYG